MPELPEVETLKLGLQRYLIGHKIVNVEIKSARIFQSDQTQIVGARITDVRRFAKVLSIDFSNAKSLLIHVKMTGQPIYRGPNLKGKVELSKKVSRLPGRHTRVIIKFDKGGVLYYNDLRQFGWMKVVPTKDVEFSDFIGKLGPEPFKDLDFAKFQDILSRSKRPIKMVLMDQERIGGIGNIYANDSLWMAGIDPKRPANSLDEKEQKELYDKIIAVLKDGIKYGGASELQFVTADGTEGGYQNHFKVYAQQNKLCLRCKKEKIQKYFLAGRGTYYCPVCQK